MADLAVRIAFLPVLIAQALSVRRTALRLPEAKGARRGNTGDGPRLRLLIIGDSSAAGVGVAWQDQALAGRLTARLAETHAVDWRLEAETGADTAAMIARLAATDPQPYDVVVSALVVNDVIGLVSRRSWARRQAKLAQLLRTRFETRLHVVSGLPPLGQFPLLPQPLRWVLGRQAVRFDATLANLAKAMPGCVHVPMDLALDQSHMAADGYHPGPEIYSAWAAKVTAAIRAAPWPVTAPDHALGTSPDDRSQARSPA